MYGFDAGGWYDYPGDKGLSDAYHYLLHSRWGGIISALEYNGASSAASLGVHVLRYQREHWLTQRPALDSRFYDNTGYKGEQSLFAKGSTTHGRVTLFGDAQLRLEAIGPRDELPVDVLQVVARTILPVLAELGAVAVEGASMKAGNGAVDGDATGPMTTGFRCSGMPRARPAR